MKAKPFPNFDTPTGIRRVAEHLDGLAADPANWDDGTPDHRIGHLTIRPTYRALTKASEILRGKHRRTDAHTTKKEPGVMDLDAVKHCGSPEAALATIRRQLDTQCESMDPVDVKRCERAAALIKDHIEALAREAAQKAEDEALDDLIAEAWEPGMSQTDIPAGTPAKITYSYRDYLGTVLTCKIGPHPILGKRHPVALYTVTVSHIRETREKRYAFHSTKPKVLKKLIWNQIRILP